MRIVNDSAAWLRIAVVYFAIGVTLGVGMGAIGDHSLGPVHSHVTLLGWVTMALFALLYRQFPELAAGRLATAQFWLYNIGLALMVVTLAGVVLGNPRFEPWVGLASAILVVAVVLFAINVFGTLRRAR